MKEAVAVVQPYYQDDKITLYHGDCIEIDDWLAADVLVTDPPYGMAFVSSRTTQKRPVANDHNADVRDSALRLWGAKPAAVFGTWRVDKPKDVQQVLIWDKRGAGPGMGDLSTAFGTSHEEIYLLGHWAKRAARRGSVITTESSPSSLTTKIGHPTPKPVGLMEIIVAAAQPGIIADPFAGSGSTLIAARNLGCRAVGVEIEERYCELIARRLAQGCLDFEAGA
jgi:site-specific DNA-methyltransferase (adenine-specific)